MNYSLKQESKKVFESLLNTEELQFPKEVQELASSVEFYSASGVDKPIIPTCLKLTESSAAIWGTIAVWVNAIIDSRYGSDKKQELKVDLDKATLNLVGVAMVQFNGKSFLHPDTAARFNLYDRADTYKEPYRALTTNLYQTKDGKFFHLHGSMNSTATLTMLGLPAHNTELVERGDVISFFNKEVQKYDSEWLDVTANERYRQAGAIPLTKEEFAQTEHGIIANKFPLYSLGTVNKELPPVEWPKPTKGTLRPLEGINVLDVSRVIAAPQITKILAFLGANVIRVSNESQPDMALLLFDSNLGKKDTTIDLKTQEGKNTLESLIENADVMLDGYRPGALARLGFSQDYVQFLAKRRGKGIVFVRENCYGFEGPWSHRSGWQQISDCITGVCWAHGKDFMKMNEPIIPVFPNADYQAAFAGASAILNALWKRNKYGGSFNVDVSLTAYDVFLMNLGYLPEEEQDRLREEASRDESSSSLMKIRFHNDMSDLIPRGLMFFKKLHPKLFQPKNFGLTDSKWHPEKKEESFTYLKLPLEASAVDFVPDIGTCPCGSYPPKW